MCADVNVNMNCPAYVFTPNTFPPESSLLHDNVAFVLCLDSLANADELYMHVSRPPKAETPMHSFMQLLEEVTRFTAWLQNAVVKSCQSDFFCWFLLSLPGGFLQVPLGDGGFGP